MRYTFYHERSEKMATIKDIAQALGISSTVSIVLRGNGEKEIFQNLQLKRSLHAQKNWIISPILWLSAFGKLILRIHILLLFFGPPIFVHPCLYVSYAACKKQLMHPV